MQGNTWRNYAIAISVLFVIILVVLIIQMKKDGSGILSENDTNQATTTLSNASSAATTAIEIFRDVFHSQVLAQCTNSTGSIYAAAGWECTDKTSGKTISRQQYLDLLLKYLQQ